MKIYPSILSADFLNLEAELLTISAADGIHVDVMDNNFVPNLTFGQQMLSRLKDVAKLPLDVHLMITNADYWAPKFAELGPSSVTFHIEACKDPIKTISEIRATGSKAAVAIKPNTPVSEIVSLLSEMDMLLVMTVEPGFGGQKLLPATLEKIAEASREITSRSLPLSIQVDGGVTSENISQLAGLGAEVFVAGSAVFSHSDRNLRIQLLREAAISGV